MFYAVLVFLLILGIFTGVVVVQNIHTLFSTNIYLNVLVWAMPGIPVWLLCLVGALVGALILYEVALYSARRDRQEIKTLRARIEDLEKASAKSSSGGSAANFAPSVVPIPGFTSNSSQGPSGPANPPGQPGPLAPGSSGSLGQRQPPPNSLQSMSPSASGNNLSLPPRLFPQQQQQMGGPRPPFPHS